MHSIETVSLDDAKFVAAAAAAKAVREGWPVVIAILDRGGHSLYLERADDVQLGSIVVAQEKARTALLFKRPTKVLQDRVNGEHPNMLSLPGATAIDGGIPLVRGDQIVGSIGVSGVLSTQDAEVAAAGVSAFDGLC